MITNMVLVGHMAISSLGLRPSMKHPMMYANAMQKKPVLIFVL